MPRWNDTTVSKDKTYHIYKNNPLYSQRFKEVLKFHHPGLAPVVDSSGAYHINMDGSPAYKERFLRTFGYYEERAAVSSDMGWYHILSDGKPLYPQRYSFCGNYQYQRCVVRDNANRYFHINLKGERVYESNYCYVGDFKDDYAVVRLPSGRCKHIDTHGNFLNNKSFLDLDVFHKGFARCKDQQGWFHSDISGSSIYEQRFNWVEPFYNGQALVETKEGKKKIIDETGSTIMVLDCVGV